MSELPYLVSLSTDDSDKPAHVAMNGFVGYLAHEDPKALPFGQKSAQFVVMSKARYEFLLQCEAEAGA